MTAESITSNVSDGIQSATTVALEPHAVCRRTTSGLTMLFDRAKGVMYELNESASSIVELLSEQPKGIDEIVQALVDEFDAPRAEIQADVDDFIKDFVTAELLRLA
jgi:hypothetical protein